MPCKCHGETWCPDLVFIGYDEDQPVFKRRDSPEGKAAIEFEQKMQEERDLAEFDRLKNKYGG